MKRFLTAALLAAALAVPASAMADSAEFCNPAGTTGVCPEIQTVDVGPRNPVLPLNGEPDVTATATHPATAAQTKPKKSKKKHRKHKRRNR